MTKVFGIITAIVLALSAFIAFKNKAAYEEATAATATQKELLTKVKARLKAAEEVLAALPVERAGVDAESDKLTEQESAMKKANEELTATSDSLTAKIAENKAKLDDIRQKTEKTGDLKELASKMRTMNAEVEELKQSIAANEAKLANLIATTQATDTQSTALKNDFEIFAKGESLPSLKTRIRSIYPNWGFVTLGSGNSAGVMSNSTLAVVRDGATIAKLLVTSVETSTASASIVPDSLAPDVTLMVGDQVVPGSK
jgi:myosin heavy subunit